MRLPSPGTVLPVCLLACVLTSTPAFAQNWSFDARRIGLGGVGSTANVALSIVDEQRKYKAIVLPFGLAQVLPNLPKLDPTKDDFDLVRAIEYSASPIHYIVGRDNTSSASAVHQRPAQRHVEPGPERLPELFALDQRDGRGPGVAELGPHVQVPAGRQRRVSGRLCRRRDLLFDEHGRGDRSGACGRCFRARRRSTSRIPASICRTTPKASSASRSPAGIAAVSRVFGTDAGGSAGPGGGNQALDGLYVGANFHYLHGFGYEHFLPAARLDTNAQGLLFVNPALGLPSRSPGRRRAEARAWRSTWARPPSWAGGSWVSA